MAESVDQPMENTLESETHLPFSEDEKKILALYGQLQELRLEIAIINGQRSHKRDKASNFSDEATQKAQADLLESRAKYVLRNELIETVMTTNPILKAVHNSTHSSSVDSDLLPYVQRRDEVTISVAKQAAQSDKQLAELTSVQSETLRISHQNVELTAELLKLAGEVKLKKTGGNNKPALHQQKQTLEAQVRESRQRWRVVKGVASGVIVGSGVDWAADDEMREIVLDPETDE